MKRISNTRDLPNRLVPFVWRYLKQRKLYLIGFILVALVWAIIMSLTPYLLKIIIDTVVKYANEQDKLFTAISIPIVVYILMTIILNLNFRLYDYINLKLYPYLKGSVDKDMFSYLLDHSYSFFQNTFTGNLTRKIWDMAENIEPLISIPNEWFYPRFFAAIIASFTLFKVVHPLFGIILFVWTTIYVYISYIAAKGAEKYARHFSENVAKMTGTASDSISNVVSVKLFDNKSHETVHLSKDVDRLVDSDRALQWYNLKINLFQDIDYTILIAAMLIALVYGLKQHWVSPGDFALVLSLSISLMWSVQEMGRQMQRFSKVVGTCNQALSIIRIPHEITDALDAKPLHVHKGEIKFNNVLFHYENNKPLFDNLNVTIKPGEKVGLVGFSGGGKSTFIKLILRLIDIQKGSILIDDQDVKNVTISSLRKQIGTIPQEPELFHRTIIENIRFAKPDASDDEVIEAAKHAKCHEFISELPDGYQSLVGERGIKLSGGQKQRIAIARAFLKNVPILLLDEATSSLDSLTESSIHEALHEIMANKTTIVIAHRLSTLKDMDRILVFVQGKIVEDGSLETLLQNKASYFYKLWQMQAQGFIPSVSE
jgi:ATP-binding cassette, subfamily B, bacterial